MDESQPRSSDYLTVVADHLPSMLAYWGCDLRCRFANSAYENWFGANSDALLGTSIKDLLGPDLFKRNEPYIRAVLAGQDQSFERFVPHPDGGGRHSLANYIAHRVDGEVVGFIVQVTDVSPLKEAQAALVAEIAERQHAVDRLRRSEAALREAQRLGRIGSWEWEIEPDIVTWSEELYRIFGRDPSRLPPGYEAHSELYTPDSLVVLRSAVERSLATGEGYLLELQYRRLDGQTGWIESRAEAIRDASGAIVALRGVAQEITTRRELESARAERDAALASSRVLLERELKDSRTFQALFDQGPYFATVLSLDGAVIDSNDACREAGSYLQVDLVDRKLWECGWWNRSAELVGRIRRRVEQAASGVGSRRETPFYASDGLERLADLIIVPVKDAKGRVIFIASIGMDISDRKLAEEELRQLAYRLAKVDEQKGIFLATLGHEMLNLLSPVHSGLHLLGRTVGVPPAVDRARQRMSRQIDHLSRLVGDLFDIERVNTGKIILDRERCEVQEILDRSLEISFSALQAARVRPVMNVPIDPLVVHVDPLRMAQVFANLLNNAAKFTPAGGHIEIDARESGGEFVVSISDDGIGMAAEDVGRVFEMFSQVQRSESAGAAGLGIGLAVVRAIVQAHGGRVQAASPGLGGGSTFTVFLPA